LPVVRRLPWSLVSVVIAASAAALGACSNNPAGTSGTRVDTVQAATPYTGTMTNNLGVTNFFGFSEIEVGDVDATNPGQTDRGAVTFNVITFEGDTVQSAVLRLDECNVQGAPFTDLGNVIVDGVAPGTPPGNTQYMGTPLATYDTLATSTTTGFLYDTVTSSVATAITDSATYAQFRLRFTGQDGNSNGVTDLVSFRSNETGFCPGDSTRAPILILTIH
jgi:hypothetical protein